MLGIIGIALLVAGIIASLVLVLPRVARMYSLRLLLLPVAWVGTVWGLVFFAASKA